MEIQVWTDFECPYCFLGMHRLHRAMNIVGMKDLKITPRSFLLNLEPDKPDGLTMAELVQQRYGGELEDIRRSFDNLRDIAKTEGLDINQADARWGYAMDAHRLMHFAKTKGLENHFYTIAQEALFQRQLLLSDHAVLLDLAEEAGLDRAEAQAVLNSDRYKKEVLADDAVAREMVIDYVPYYILNGTQHFSGDRSLDDYVRELRKARADKAAQS